MPDNHESSHDSNGNRSAVHRRSVLGGLAGLGVLGASIGSGTAGGTDSGLGSVEERLADRTATGTGSYHPGQPLFVSVGEQLWNTAWVGPEFIGDRDNLAPGIPEPEPDPENYDADDFVWSVEARPADSDVDLTYGTSLFEDRPRYDEGRENVAEFEADAPGRYVLELDAPDGTHRLTIEALPDDDSVAGGPPRLELDATVTDGTVTVETNAAVAPDSSASPDDLEASVLVDDRDALATADVDVNGTTATVDLADLEGEPARIHAVAHDGNRRSVADAIEVRPDGEVRYPNRPPEWLLDGVMYQIFTRSWAGQRGKTTLDTLIDGTVTESRDAAIDGANDELTTNARAARGVDYLASSASTSSGSPRSTPPSARSVSSPAGVPTATTSPTSSGSPTT